MFKWLKGLFSKSYSTGCIPDILDDRDFPIESILEELPILPDNFVIPYYRGWFDNVYNVRLDKVQIKFQNGFGSCFHANTPIMIEDFSYRNISDINIGDYVFTHKGNLEKVTEIFKRKWQGTSYKLKIWGDYKEVEVTGEHPFLAIKRKNKIKRKKEVENNINFYKIEDLEKNDWVAIPFNNKIVKDKTIYSFENDKDFLWVVGLYLAEGSIDKYSTVFSLHRKEIYFYDRIKDIMSKYGASVTYSYKGKNGLTVKINSKKWSKIFKELGSKICDKKEINKRLMFLEPKLQMNIYNGLLDGDGCTKNNREVIVSTSKKLLEQIRIILLRNGIYSGLTKRKKRIDRKDVYVLEKSNGKNRYSFIRDNYVFTLIKSIKKNKSYAGGHVYNLEVEKDNSYLVNGIAVHNCVSQSTTRQKEGQEGVELSARDLHIYCKANDGIPHTQGTYLRTAQQGLVDRGVCEEVLYPEIHKPDITFEQYIDANLISLEAANNRLEHKAKSYFSVKGFDKIRQSLYQYKVSVSTGSLWYEGDNNMKPDFKMKVATGKNVGGHAFCIIGWKKIGTEIYLIAVNSWGQGWGNEGLFYIKSSIANLRLFDSWITIDIERNLAEILLEFNNKTVKTKSGKNIHFISGGKKRLFSDEFIFWSNGHDFKDVVIINNEDLDLIPIGEPMSFVYDATYTTEQLKRFTALFAENHTKAVELFDKYFK